MVVWEDEQFLKYWIIFLPRSDAEFELKSTEVLMWLAANSWVEINTELPPNEAVSVVNYHLRFIISLKYLVVQLILWWSSLRDQKHFWKLSPVNAALCCFHQWKLCLSSFKLWASSRSLSVVISVRSQQTAADWRFHRENTFLCYFSLDVVSDEEAGVGGNVRPDELSVSSCLDSSLQLKHINHIFKEQTLNKSF